MKEKLHIVFGKSTSGLLRMSFKYNSSIFGNILSLNDDMSMGPIANLDNISGIRVRKNWWDTVTKDTYYNTWVLNEVDANIEKYQYIKNDLKKQTYVWVGNDATSIVGFIRLMDQLEGIDKELFLIDCSHKYTRAKNSITGISSFNYTQSLDPKIMASLFFQAGKINVDKRRAVAEKWKQLLLGHDNLRISKINGDIQGVTRQKKDISIKIPAGIGDGATIRLTQHGETSAKGISGDLYVNIRVKPDKKFTREGNLILSDETIDMVDAALGVNISVETVDGKEQLDIPAGTQSGSDFKLSDRGVPFLNGKGRGDHIVRIIVETPKKLSKKQKQILEEFKNTPRKTSWL